MTDLIPSMNEFVFSRIASASIHGLVALVFAFAITRLFSRLPADCQAWIWRLAIGRFLIALIWEMPLAMLPAGPGPSAAPVATVPAATVPLAESSTLLVSQSTPIAAPTPLHPITIIWAVGTLFILGKGLLGWYRLWRIAQRAYRVDGRARMSLEAKVPFLIGNTIVLPASMSVEARVAALAHELAHRTRRDPYYSLPNFAVSALFWFVVPVWLALREYAIQVEIDCDRRALRLAGVSPRHYGGLLVALATGSPSPVGAAAMAGSPDALRRRLKAMKNDPKPRTITTLALTLALGAIVLLPIRPVEAVAPTQSTEVRQSQAKIEKAQKALNQAILQLNKAVEKDAKRTGGNAQKEIRVSGGPLTTVVVTSKDGKTKTYKVNGRALSPKEQKEFDRKMSDLDREMAKLKLDTRGVLMPESAIHWEIQAANAKSAAARSAADKAAAQAGKAAADQAMRVETTSRSLDAIPPAEMAALRKELEILRVEVARAAQDAKSIEVRAIAPAEAPRSIEVKAIAGSPLTVQEVQLLEAHAKAAGTSPGSTALPPVRTIEVHALPPDIARGADAGTLPELIDDVVVAPAIAPMAEIRDTVTAIPSAKTRSGMSLQVTAGKNGTITILENGKTRTVRVDPKTRTARVNGYVIRVSDQKGKNGTLTITVTKQ
jgi:beta-lactamase regulating signal transducer with metallopeptidase domain